AELAGHVAHDILEAISIKSALLGSGPEPFARLHRRFLQPFADFLGAVRQLLSSWAECPLFKIRGAEGCSDSCPCGEAEQRQRQWLLFDYAVHRLLES